MSEVPVNIDDAIQMTTSEYPGGAEALAVRMGVDPAQFRSKANPNIERAYFRPGELVTLQQFSGKHYILHAMADELGEVCLPKVEVSDEDVVKTLARLTKEFSDVLSEATVAMADGTLSKNERKRMQRELTQLMTAAGAVLPALEHAGKSK